MVKYKYIVNNFSFGINLLIFNTNHSKIVKKKMSIKNANLLERIIEIEKRLDKIESHISEIEKRIGRIPFKPSPQPSPFPPTPQPPGPPGPPGPPPEPFRF